jgi:hypothetical protein
MLSKLLSYIALTFHPTECAEGGADTRAVRNVPGTRECFAVRGICIPHVGSENPEDVAVRPYFDKKALASARKFGLPADPEKRATLAPRQNAKLAAALIRVSLDGP